MKTHRLARYVDQTNLPWVGFVFVIVVSYSIISHTLPEIGYQRELQQQIGYTLILIIFLISATSQLTDIENRNFININGFVPLGIFKLLAALLTFYFVGDVDVALAKFPILAIIMSLVISGFLDIVSVLISSVKGKNGFIDSIFIGVSYAIAGLGQIAAHLYIIISRSATIIDSIVLLIISLIGVVMMFLGVSIVLSVKI